MSADNEGVGADDITAELGDIKKLKVHTMMHCANCGKAEVDDVKLMDCDKCDLASYCGDECQQDHRVKHEAICNKRAAELREEILFTQPESSTDGDCPICFLPFPLDEKKSSVHPCCCKMICQGCWLANYIREEQQRLKHKCPYCRKQVAKSNEEIKTRFMNRAKANDPVALRELGRRHYSEGDYDKAFEYYTKAIEFCDAIAHSCLAGMYFEGHGVEEDEGKSKHHFEEAAIAGHPGARYILGLYEGENGRLDRAVKHWIIAANLGEDDSLEALKEWYKRGHVSKDDLAAALRAHQAAIDATKSPQREAAARY